jgi:hypothetical protein
MGARPGSCSYDVYHLKACTTAQALKFFQIRGRKHGAEMIYNGSKDRIAGFVI